MSPEIAGLVRLVDQAFDRKAWHGPNLRGSVRTLTHEDAAWRPSPDRHSIAEQVLHSAYWKYTVRRRLNGEKRGSFGLKGSNWFPVDEGAYSASLWKCHLVLLDETHASLRAAVAGLHPARLDQVPERSRVTYRDLIQGIALHDVYHAGQIQLLKRLRG